MKDTQLIMDMPIVIEILDKNAEKKDIDTIFEYFHYVDEKFSTFKNTSEITKINKGLLKKNQWSSDMKEVLTLSEKTKVETDGYFDIKNVVEYDPSGIVKGWAILNASKKLKKMGYKNFYIDAGGDIQVSGLKKNRKWLIGIRNPFNRFENVKIIAIKNRGVATSGIYIRGQHIYNPYNKKKMIEDIVSLTVIGPNVYEADRFATAAFAMGKKGIDFIEKLKGFEGYMINNKGIAIMTTGFENYVFKNENH